MQSDMQESTEEHVEQVERVERVANTQLMDLPDGLLAHIFGMLMEIPDWYGADLALCSRRWLDVLFWDPKRIVRALEDKPWMIHTETGVLTAWSWHVHRHDPKGLKSALRYLEQGYIKKLCLVLADTFLLSTKGEMVYTKLSDEQIEEMIEGWPLNKVVFHYSNI